MQQQPYFWLGSDYGGSSVNLYWNYVPGDNREINIFGADQNIITGYQLGGANAYVAVASVSTNPASGIYYIFLSPNGSPCADFATCLAQYPIYQKLYGRVDNQNCTYQYQTVAGSLDSYPVVQSSQCYTFVQEQVPEPCGSSTSSPCYAHTDYGDIVLVLLVMLTIMFIAGISFLSSALKRKMGNKKLE